jgi:hypothetical protein
MTTSISRILCRQFLLLYPEPFRNEFGDEMLSVFEECRAAQGSWHVLADVFIAAAKQQIRSLAVPVPKSEPLYSEIASSPNLARILAVTVFAAMMITGVLTGGKAKSADSWTMVRSEVRFWFPTGIVILERKPNGAKSWRLLRPERGIWSPRCSDRPEHTARTASISSEQAADDLSISRIGDTRRHD